MQGRKTEVNTSEQATSSGGAGVSSSFSSADVGLGVAAAAPPKRGRKRVAMSTLEEGPMATLLQKDWLLNKKTAKQVQEYAEAAESSGAQGVSSLAGVALEGFSSKNLSRDIRRRLQPQNMENGPPLYWLAAQAGKKHPMVLWEERSRVVVVIKGGFERCLLVPLV